MASEHPADPPAPSAVPDLSDEVVRLRALDDADVPGLIAFARDPRSRRYVALPDPYDEGDARAFVERARAGAHDGPRRLDWAVEVDGRFVGSIDVRLDTGGRAEFGYGIHPDARGRGIASRAARLVVDHVFDDLGVEVMAWRADADNLASWRVAWSLGFRLDGERRSMHRSTDGRLTDERYATLLRAEPRRPRHPWFEPADLVGERVRLRPWRSDDAPSTEPDEVAERFNTGMLPGPATFESWRLARLRRMSRSEGVFWCIADATDDRPLGGIQLARLDGEFDRGSGSLGYWLFEGARGRGYVQDAIDLLVGHAFAPRTDLAGARGLGLHRLVAGADADNRASQRALRRSGFREIGRERALIAQPDRDPSDAFSFELLASSDRAAQTIEPAFVTVLTTARLRLRPWRHDDIPRVEHELDRDAMRFMPADAQPTTATFEEWFGRRQRHVDRGAYHWCIARAADDEPLGMFSMWDPDQQPTARSFEIGYWIYPAFRGHGYLREAAARIVEHAFAPTANGGLALNRLHAGTDADNRASQAVLRRLGFTQWGHDHQAFVTADGSISDGRYFELLAAQRPVSE